MCFFGGGAPGVSMMQVRSALDPGMADITWTSHEWKEFTDRCLYDVEVSQLHLAHELVQIFHDLVHRANDIYDNRVEKLLDSMTRIEVLSLVVLPISSCMSCQQLNPGCLKLS